jgi:parallel beta-helix repeat protein
VNTRIRGNLISGNDLDGIELNPAARGTVFTGNLTG